MKRKCLFLSFAMVTWALFLSCENPLLPIPGYEGIKREGASSEVPLELNATQGYKREITLTWTPVAGAIRYNIYRSDTPGGDFQIIGESSSDAAIQTISQPQGTDAWYRVAAVKYNGVKDMSHPVRGTTLAQPIITDVEGGKGNADSEMWVYWYMGNEDAYRNNVMYTVYAYVAGSSAPKAVKRVSGTDASNLGGGTSTAVMFDNLDPLVTYVFEVEAYNISDQDNTERSERRDAETARRLRPNAPKNLTISQGDSKSEIKIQFDLPVKVDVNHGTDDEPIYYAHDLYFKIFRRQVGHNNWNEICSYFGKDSTSNNTSNVSGSGKKLKFESTDGTPYNDYVPERTVVYTDNNSVGRGIKFEYKVQAYQDTAAAGVIANGTENKSSESTSTDKSISYDIGWTISTPTFFTKDLNAVTAGEPPQMRVTEISIGFGLEFDTYGLDSKYKYLIAEYKENGDDARTLYYSGRKKLCNTEDELEYSTFWWAENASDIDRLTDETVHYVYKLFIFSSKTDVGEDSNSWENASLDSVQAHGRLSVSSKPGEPPVIESFSLISGYADKFVIKWKYNQYYKYAIYYQDAGKSSFEMIEENLNNHTNISFAETISKANDGDEVEFKHDATHGLTRTYYLVAMSGVYSTYTPRLTGKTLSEPDVKQYLYDYDKVGVKWHDNGDADNFEFKIDGVSNNISKAKNELVRDNEREELSYIFEGLKNEISASYKDATKSGEPMPLKVKATGAVKKQYAIKTGETIKQDSSVSELQNTGETSYVEKEISVHTLGPALTAPSASVVSDANSITLTWNGLEGAKAYMVVRRGYETNVRTNKIDYINAFDDSCYVVKGTSVSLSGGVSQLVPGSVSVSFSASDNKYTLRDNSVDWPTGENGEGNGWQKAQARIKWGVPNDYFVIPLKDENDIVTYDTEGKKVTVNSVTMTNIDNEKVQSTGAALGYGWNVTASKGVELITTTDGYRPNKTVKVSWENPYGHLVGATYNIFRRKENGNWESLANNEQNLYYKDDKAEPGTVYEYSVGLNYSKESNPTDEKDKKYITKHIDGNKDEKWDTEKRAAGFILPQAKVLNVSRGKRILDGHYAEDIEWGAVRVGNQLNRMIDGYVIEVYNGNVSPQTSDKNDSECWVEMAKISFDGTLKHTDKYNTSGAHRKATMLRAETTYAHAVATENTNTHHNDKDKLIIKTDHKHWFRVRAFTEKDDVVTCSKPYNPQDYNPNTAWNFWRPEQHGNDSNSGIKWGTRGMTDREFIYAATVAMDPIIHSAASAGPMGAWQTQTGNWYVKDYAGGGKHVSTSNGGVNLWAFYMFMCTQNFLKVDGRIGARTASSGNWPYMYFTAMWGRGADWMDNYDMPNKTNMWGDYNRVTGVSNWNGNYKVGEFNRIKIEASDACKDELEDKDMFTGWFSFGDLRNDSQGDIKIWFASQGHTIDQRRQYTSSSNQNILNNWTGLRHK